jgi:hypothetical protein
MRLEHNKSYVTKSGYVVHIVKDGSDYFSTIETSPGRAGIYNSAADYDAYTRRYDRRARGYGWEYGNDGMCGHNHMSMSVDLNIVRELLPSDKLELVGGFVKLVPVTNVSTGESPTEEEEVTMKKETAIAIASATAKFAGNAAFKAANYFAIEPAMNIGRPIVRSIRYAMFVGGLGFVAYGWNHPEAAKAAVSKCLPSISFSIERPEILK